jgi:GxxExxY protein
VKSAAITHEVIEAAMEVHNLLGPGFLESIYKRAVIHGLHVRGLTANTEVELRITYKDHVVGRHRMDIIVSDLVIVELKAVAAINDLHIAQAISYLTALNSRWP